MYCGVYIIKNKINNHFYIGSASNITKRFCAHRRLLIKNMHHNIHLQRACNKYGLENFEFIILEECMEIDKLDREQYYINTLKPEYNISKSSYAPMTGRKHKPETIVKFRNRKTVSGPEHYSYGTKWTPEIREKILKKRIGQKRSDEFKRGQSERAIKNEQWKYLKTHIENGRKKIVDNFQNTFDSLVDAAKYWNVSVQAVCDNLKGRSKFCTRKVQFKYA